MLLANLPGSFCIKDSVLVTRLMLLLAVPDVKLLDELDSHSPVSHLESPVQKQSCPARGLPRVHWKYRGERSGPAVSFRITGTEMINE